MDMYSVGRWLVAEHPTVTSPEQWDEDLALDYVEFLRTATVGCDVPTSALKLLEPRGIVGQRYAPASIRDRLVSIRRFFSDLQDHPHTIGDVPPQKLALNFKPQSALATPLDIKREIHPKPRDIDITMWYKLAYAAATLTPDTVAQTKFNFYPPSLYRAVALLWVTSGRRPNEILRARVDCVRRDWDPDFLDEDGQPLPQPDQSTEESADAHLCYFHVPSGKTRGPFWVWIPTYTASAIKAWQQERPSGQPALHDAHDNKDVDFLFCVRNHKVGTAFLNESVIPLLCRVANVPEEDAYGAVTGVRGRHTRATILRRLGVSIADIAVYLGHADTRTVEYYARTDPVQLARTLKKANDLERIVTGLIDARAKQVQQPNVFFYLGKGPDGKPRY
jgi:integrase